MNKSLFVFALLLLLATPALQQVTIVNSRLIINPNTLINIAPTASAQAAIEGSSGDGNSNEPETQDESSAMPDELKGVDVPKSDNSSQAAASTNITADGVAFRTLSLTSGCTASAKWLKICRKFYITCPENGIWFKFFSGGPVYVVINGQLVNTTPFYPPSSGYWVYISGKYLTCGCNEVCFYTWGRCPWLSYTVWYPAQNCTKCSASLSFFNYRTCRCECQPYCCKDGWYRPITPVGNSCNCRGRIIISSFTALRAGNGNDTDAGTP
jgi:hypothetical protein